MKVTHGKPTKKELSRFYRVAANSVKGKTRKQLLARKKKLERTFMDMNLRDAYYAIEEIIHINSRLKGASLVRQKVKKGNT